MRTCFQICLLSFYFSPQVCALVISRSPVSLKSHKRLGRFESSFFGDLAGMFKGKAPAVPATLEFVPIAGSPTWEEVDTALTQSEKAVTIMHEVCLVLLMLNRSHLLLNQSYATESWTSERRWPGSHWCKVASVRDHGRAPRYTIPWYGWLVPLLSEGSIWNGWVVRSIIIIILFNFLLHFSGVVTPRRKTNSIPCRESSDAELWRQTMYLLCAWIFFHIMYNFIWFAFMNVRKHIHFIFFVWNKIYLTNYLQF